uniref:Glycosyltransferases n=1 Tax=Chenopodium quinoa TaxID=63459 RepID=A0A803N4S3_CHEQI
MECMKEAKAKYNSGALPGFDPTTRMIRESDWVCDASPPAVADRRVEIMGPNERKIVIYALNSGAKVFMFMDSYASDFLFDCVFSYIATVILVRDRILDGLVVFADDSNMHSMEFFDEVQKVNNIGALSVGIIVHSGDPNEPLRMEKIENDESSLPIQGPACNSLDSLVGWHTFDTSPYVEKSSVHIGDIWTVLPRKVEWAGFVLNSRRQESSIDVAEDRDTGDEEIKNGSINPFHVEDRDREMSETSCTRRFTMAQETRCTHEVEDLSICGKETPKTTNHEKLDEVEQEYCQQSNWQHTIS